PAVAADLDAAPGPRRDRPAVRGDAEDAGGVDGATAARSRRRFPGEGDGVPRGDGGARALWPAVPGVRRGGAADHLRGERDELLCALSDRRQAARGSVAEPALEG